MAECEIVLSTWEDLPIWFKQDLIGLLDFKSRQNLRACSKNDQFLVDSFPFFIKTLAVFFSSTKNSMYCSSETANFSKHSTTKNDKIINSASDLTRYFIRFFQHPKSTVDVLTMEFSDLEKAQILIEEIEKFEKKTGKQFRVNAKKLIWYSCRQENFPAVKFVEYLKPGTLESIRFELYQSENLKVMRQLMETEQWKQAQELTTSQSLPVGVDIEGFAHARWSKMEIMESEFNVEKIQNFITKFKNADHPPKSYFSIMTHFQPTSNDRSENDVESSKPIIVEHREIIIDSPHYYFRMPTSKHFLSISRSPGGIQGLVRENDDPIPYFII